MKFVTRDYTKFLYILFHCFRGHPVIRNDIMGLMINVHFYANFRQICGGKTVAFDLPEHATLQALLDAVGQRFPKLTPLLWAEAGQLLPHVRVFVNGHDSQYLPDGLATILTPSDKVDIFPPITGGAF